MVGAGQVGAGQGGAGTGGVAGGWAGGSDQARGDGAPLGAAEEGGGQRDEQPREHESARAGQKQRQARVAVAALDVAGALLEGRRGRDGVSVRPRREVER